MLLYCQMKEKDEKTTERSRYGIRKLATMAVLTALSLIVFVIEAQFPPLFIPGAKLGLANIFSLFVLLLYGPAEAAAVVLCRSLLSALITGPVSALLYSLPAGLISIALSALLVRKALSAVSLVSISVAGAVLHNIVQNIVFVALNGAPEMLFYMPYLALIGVASGACVGLALHLLVRHLPIKLLTRLSKGDIK